MANTFYIIKKVGNYFVHRFNDGAKEVELSDFEAVLEFISQTFNVQAKNGSNLPKTPVLVTDIIVIDETDASVEETFITLTALRARLIQLNYTPYVNGTNADSITGLIVEGTNVTITGTGTLADPYVINSTGGGGSQDLQSVTDVGATTTNAIVTGNITATDVGGGDTPFLSRIDTTETLSFLSVYQINNSVAGALTADDLTSARIWNFRDMDGDIAFLSDITGGATNLGYTASPTDGTVTSDTGTDATLPLADTTNAGLLAPADKTKLNNTSGTNTGDNSANTNSNAYADAKVTDAIVDGVTAIAPSQNAVFDALALKADLVSGLVPSSQLPAYVDDILDGYYVNSSQFDDESFVPYTPARGKIYVDLNTNTQYRWTGTSYIQITNGAIASTSDVSEGSNLYFTAARVLATVLTGISFATGGAIVSTDTVLQAFGKIQKQINDLGSTYQALSTKDATGGYVGMTLFKINFKNAANTFTSFLTNSNTAARTYTFQDRNGTIADDTDVTSLQTLINNRIKVVARSGTATSALTGTTTETQMLQLTLPIGTFSLTDFINVSLRLVKTTATSTVTWRIKISTSATMPLGNTDRVAVFTDATGVRSQEILRTFWQNGGNLTGVDFATSLNIDIGVVTTTGLSTIAFNNTTTQYYLYISAQLTNAADSVYIANYEITN